MLRALTVIVLVALGAAPAGAVPEPGSVLVGCDQAGARVTVSVDSHLDPACA